MQSYEMRIYHSQRKQNKQRKQKRRLVALLVLAALALLVLLFFILRVLLGGGKTAAEGTTVIERIFGSGGPPYVIALDAGHGGKDVGAEGLIQEVELTETTVAYLFELLDKDDNFSPLLCREYGEGATPTERAKAATNAAAELLLSVHGNSDYGEGSTGFECYPAPPGRKYHEQSLNFATLLASEMGAAGSRLRGEGGVRYAYYVEDEVGTSTKIFREMSDSAEYADVSFGVVDKPDCPAVLAEQCFVTSSEDLAAFGGEEGCRRAAECYYRAICAYFETKPIF